MCCAGVLLEGCANIDRQISRHITDEPDQEHDKAHPQMDLSQPVILNGRAFEKQGLETNGAIALEKRQHFDTDVEAKENFITPEEKDLQINSTEFLIPAAKFSHPYSLLGNTAQTNNNDFSWEGQEFEPEGLPLFRIPF